MLLYIKHMVCIRCKMVVKAALEELHLGYTSVELGRVTLQIPITVSQRQALKAILIKTGLEVMDNKRAITIEKIKLVITDMVRQADELPKMKYSCYIAQKLNLNYTHLSELFSEVTGTTIEHYIINHKIEYVKELLLYNELNLTQISYKLDYSSVCHLSNQFKKVTGLTPTRFKQLKGNKRIPLHHLDTPRVPPIKPCGQQIFTYAAQKLSVLIPVLPPKIFGKANSCHTELSY